jgi:hypothetical protein
MLWPTTRAAKSVLLTPLANRMLNGIPSQCRDCFNMRALYSADGSAGTVGLRRQSAPWLTGGTTATACRAPSLPPILPRRQGQRL